MRIEVVLAFAEAQHCVIVDLPEGATVADALAASGLAMSGIDDEQIGVWNRRVTLAAVLRDARRTQSGRCAGEAEVQPFLILRLSSGMLR